MTTMKNRTSDIEMIDEEGGEEALQHEPNSTMENKMQVHADKKCSTNKRYMPLLVMNYLMLFVGSISSSLLAKYYFRHNGSSKWVSTWIQSAGFPLLIIPTFLPYALTLTKRKPFTDFTQKILMLSIFVGFMLGINNLLISWGVSYLPVSTSSLVLSSQLAFTLILSAIIVKQKVTFLNLNCVILITLSSIILALNHSSETSGMTQKKYLIGFFCTIGAGLLFALYLPVMEKIYKKVYCYEMVIEMQLIMQIASTILATIGMIWDGGFSQMKEEGEKVFDKGPKIYWIYIVSNIVTWQLCFMGTAGMVFLTTSLTGGICATALLSMNVLGGVVVFREAFGGLKAVSTVLCFWAFCSYVYGIYTNHKSEINKRNESSSEIITITNHAVTH
ncbi:hypothetical protein Lal_00001396 [Lupinus albus]|nr:putative purine permease, plant [Lupinus albus]KAF1891048.1 hypothetical protein Lal_00001184 [Lupinus albus]KAF1891254.1 hypothetical protein Lal_00001396 [Lupinus albus]